MGYYDASYRLLSREVKFQNYLLLIMIMLPNAQGQGEDWLYNFLESVMDNYKLKVPTVMLKEDDIPGFCLTRKWMLLRQRLPWKEKELKI